MARTPGSVQAVTYQFRIMENEGISKNTQSYLGRYQSTTIGNYSIKLE